MASRLQIHSQSFSVVFQRRNVVARPPAQKPAFLFLTVAAVAAHCFAWLPSQKPLGDAVLPQPHIFFACEPSQKPFGDSVLPQPHIFLAWLPSQAPVGESVLPHAHWPAWRTHEPEEPTHLLQTRLGDHRAPRLADRPNGREGEGGRRERKHPDLRSDACFNQLRQRTGDLHRGECSEIPPCRRRAVPPPSCGVRPQCA